MPESINVLDTYTGIAMFAVYDTAIAALLSGQEVKTIDFLCMASYGTSNWYEAKKWFVSGRLNKMYVTQKE